MNFNINSIDRRWRTAGIVVLAAGALVYPAMRLYKYIAQRRKNNKAANTEEEHTTKAFTPSYRGNHKPHRRKAETEQHHNGEMA